MENNGGGEKETLVKKDSCCPDCWPRQFQTMLFAFQLLAYFFAFLCAIYEKKSLWHACGILLFLCVLFPAILAGFGVLKAPCSRHLETMLIPFVCFFLETILTGILLSEETGYRNAANEEQEARQTLRIQESAKTISQLILAVCILLTLLFFNKPRSAAQEATAA